MPVIFIDPLSDPRYGQFVISHPHASFFHSPAWANVLHDTFGFKPASIALIENGRIKGILPFMETQSMFGKRRCISLPFSDFCEPLFDDQIDFQKVFDTLVIQGLRNRWQYIQLRGGERFLSTEIPSDTIFTHDLDLTRSEKELFGSLRQSTRRNICKAEKSSISVTHETTMQAMKEFYRLHCLTRKVHGLPPQPWFFFKNVQEKIISESIGFITSAILDGKAIASNIFILHGKKAIYKYGASDKKYQQLRPSNQALYEGIRKCRELGCHSLSLGRTEPHHRGLLQFKEGFTRNKSRINYYQYDTKIKRYISSPRPKQVGLGKAFFCRLPVPLLRYIGDIFYKYGV